MGTGPDLPVMPELASGWPGYDQILVQVQHALRGNHPAPASKQIVQQCLQLAALLLKKNAAYGDSALNPVEVFAQGMSPSQRMSVRMDDKISRLSRGKADSEDPEMDLAGYIILKRIAVVQENADIPANADALESPRAAAGEAPMPATEHWQEDFSPEPVCGITERSAVVGPGR